MRLKVEERKPRKKSWHQTPEPEIPSKSTPGLQRLSRRHQMNKGCARLNMSLIVGALTDDCTRPGAYTLRLTATKMAHMFKCDLLKISVIRRPCLQHARCTEYSVFPHDPAQARYDIHTARPKRNPGGHEFPLEALKAIFSAIADEKKRERRYPK